MNQLIETHIHLYVSLGLIKNINYDSKIIYLHGARCIMCMYTV